MHPKWCKSKSNTPLAGGLNNHTHPNLINQPGAPLRLNQSNAPSSGGLVVGFGGDGDGRGANDDGEGGMSWGWWCGAAMVVSRVACVGGSGGGGVVRSGAWVEDQIDRVARNVSGLGTPVVQKSGIQCYNCKEYGHVSRECQKPKRVKDAAYHKSQQSTRNRGKAIVTSSAPTYDPEPAMVTEDEEMSKEKEIDKLMALISLSFKKIYKPTNNNLRTSSNTSTPVVQKSGIQCFNCKEYGHVSRECQKPKRVKDATYHKEKMLLCKQEELGSVDAEQVIVG
ncbi:JmjC domain-containing protein [Tanacetum coccineum]